MINLKTPISDEQILALKAGDTVSITGTIFTARDAAHKKMIEALARGEKLPIDTNNSIIYYVGPTPAKPGEVIGSAGPTSSYRMDPYALALMEKGVKITIGKGPRSEEFKENLKKHGGVYLSAVGGAAALISQSIKKAEIIAYPELGAEAIYKLEVENFTAFVTYDSHCNDLLTDGINQFKANK
jgi:fumarate hydratase subunit beta